MSGLALCICSSLVVAASAARLSPSGQRSRGPHSEVELADDDTSSSRHSTTKGHDRSVKKLATILTSLQSQHGAGFSVKAAPRFRASTQTRAGNFAMGEEADETTSSEQSADTAVAVSEKSEPIRERPILRVKSWPKIRMWPSWGDGKLIFGNGNFDETNPFLLIAENQHSFDPNDALQRGVSLAVARSLGQGQIPGFDMRPDEGFRMTTHIGADVFTYVFPDSDALINIPGRGDPTLLRGGTAQFMRSGRGTACQRLFEKYDDRKTKFDFIEAWFVLPDHLKTANASICYLGNEFGVPFPVEQVKDKQGRVATVRTLASPALLESAIRCDGGPVTDARGDFLIQHVTLDADAAWVARIPRGRTGMIYVKEGKIETSGRAAETGRSAIYTGVGNAAKVKNVDDSNKAELILMYAEPLDSVYLATRGSEIYKFADEAEYRAAIDEDRFRTVQRLDLPGQYGLIQSERDSIDLSAEDVGQRETVGAGRQDILDEDMRLTVAMREKNNEELARVIQTSAFQDRLSQLQNKGDLSTGFQRLFEQLLQQLKDGSGKLNFAEAMAAADYKPTEGELASFDAKFAAVTMLRNTGQYEEVDVGEKPQNAEEIIRFREKELQRSKLAESLAFSEKMFEQFEGLDGVTDESQKRSGLSLAKMWELQQKEIGQLGEGFEERFREIRESQRKAFEELVDCGDKTLTGDTLAEFKKTCEQLNTDTEDMQAKLARDKPVDLSGKNSLWWMRYDSPNPNPLEADDDRIEELLR